jgi:ferredoxin-type protein NapH
VKKKSSLKTVRRLVQVSVALAFILIPLLNHYRINYLTGNFLSFRAFGLPLADPLAVLQITLKNFYLSTDLMIGAGIALTLAAVMGTVFCSWVCPFGLLSEWGQTIRQKIWSKTDQRQAGKGASFRVKIGLFILGLTGFLLFSTTPVLNQLSMPAWYSRIFQFYFEQKHISLAILFILGILVIEFFYCRRLWCRYICPQSFLLTIAKTLNPTRFKVRYRQDKCLCKKGHDPCKQACSLALDPKSLADSLDTECNNCGDCIVACKKKGQALEFTFGRN